MWNVVALLFYVFITIANSLDSNSTLLESRTNGKYKNYHRPLSTEEYNEYKWVISLRRKINGRYSIFVLGSMISPWFAISTYKCQGETLYAAPSDRIHVTDDEAHLVTKMTNLWDYMLSDFNEQAPYHEHHSPVFLTFGKKIENLPSKPDDIPYGHGGNDGILLTWNIDAERMETIPTCNNMLMLTKVRKVPNKDCGLSEGCGSRFCIKYISQKNKRLTDHEMGGPVMLGGQFAGIVFILSGRTCENFDYFGGYITHFKNMIENQHNEEK